jgi:hypothetical protein
LPGRFKSDTGVLGDTEASGEEFTLFNIIDCQVEAILLYDGQFAVHLAEDGHLRPAAAPLTALEFTARG